MLTIRNIDILQTLIKNNGEGTIKDLAEKNKISERAVRYDIENINEYLREKGLPQIEKLFKGELKLQKIIQIEDYLYKNYEQDLLLPEDRETYILIEILFNEFINLNKISDDLDVSRSTVKIDLKNVKEILNKYNLELSLKHKTGLILNGKEESVRKLKLKVILKYFRKYEVYKRDTSKYSLKDKFIIEMLDKYIGDIDIDNIKLFISHTQKLMKKIISDEAYEVIVAYLITMIFRVRIGKPLDDIQNERFLENTEEYKITNSTIAILEANYEINLNKTEVLKITDYFLGSHTYNFDCSYYDNWVEIEILVKKMIDTFNQKIEVDISKDKTLLDGLINHIKPTIYRIKNNIELQNSVYEEVIKSYSTLYKICLEVINELEEFIGEKLSKDEIAFLVIHFKAAIDRNEHKIKNIKKVLLVCGLGYGSSKLLAQQLKKMYTIDIVDIIPYHLLGKYIKNPRFDIIITTLNTLDFERVEEIPVINVNPILNKEDIYKLDEFDFPKYRKKILLSELLNVIEKNTNIIAEESLVDDLLEFMDDHIVNDIQEKSLDITDLLKVNNIRLNIDVNNLEEAILEAGNILVKESYTNINYINQMQEVVKEYGSYMMISPGIIMPHAKGEKNIYKTGMSLITLNNPVKFPNGKEVEILFAFSSLNGKEHLNSMVDLMNLINDYDLKNKLKKMKKPEEVLKLIYKYKLN